jgi:hypothetical protein
MYQFNRSDKFRGRDYGGFLNSALNRLTDFTGIQGYYTSTPTGETAVDMDADRTKAMATKRIKEQHFTASVPPPPYMETRSDTDWALLPTWVRSTFFTTKSPQPHPRYAHVMDPVTLPELKHRIKCMKKNKAGGRSGVTADLLQILDDPILINWILPLINAFMILEDMPPTAKLFAIWAIEKYKGSGSIITSAGKLNIRPIVLLEPIYKLQEAIIHSRLSRAMDKAGVLDPSQYGFSKDVGADDLLLTEAQVMEHAHQHKREIHISNNDCTAAYDSIAAWVMEMIYHYHKLPPRLINYLLNTDRHLRGQVLTAHGAGEEFSKECGLGQGSILAPLKWKLFLDPLLRLLRNTGNLYTMGSGSNIVKLYAAAFADDLGIFAPTHADYKLRMLLTNKYLSFFGVELNATKTTYTYDNTPNNQHYHPIQIWNRHTNEHAASAVAAPTKPLRYLGGWLSPSLRSTKGKRLLLASLHSILNVLQYKKLDWVEYKYIIQAVVASKALYYLNVTPLTDTELDTIDRRIANQFKRTLRMASSTSAHIFYLPETARGFNLPSIRQQRDALLLRQGYRALNDKGTLGAVFHARLQDYRDAVGETGNPLQEPRQHNKLYNTTWFARLAHVLRTNSHKICATTDIKRQGGRARASQSLTARH